MKAQFEKDVLKGYDIGNNISIHSHIKDPESWFITIRPLNIFGERLCKKDRNTQQIVRYVNSMLHNKLLIVGELISDVKPFIE